jgi:hypothetical protein
MSAPQPGSDDIHLFTRVVALIILPFLVVASVLLVGLPTRTDALFAWTIAPPFTAMLLGAAYVGGIVYFVGVLRLRAWHRVQYGIPAVFLFATLLGVATLLHWDRFHAGHLSFIVWATLYVTTPVLIAIVWVLQRTADSGAEDEPDVRIPRAARGIFAALGLASLLAGGVLFASPELLLGVWAWDVTPLTARVVGAILTLPGTVNAWMLVDARWSSFRWMMRAELVSLGFILLALVVWGRDLHGDRIATPLFLATIGAAVLGYLALYLYCERHLRQRQKALVH